MIAADRAEGLAALMRSANGGDEAAYAAFLRQAAVMIRAFAQRRLAEHGGNAEPEDIVQETLLAIHLKRHTWRPDEPIGSWLYAIARYKIIDAHRRRSRRGEVDIEPFTETLATPVPEEEPSAREIERALWRLAGRQRAAVSAISVEGRSIKDTSTILGVSEGAVRVAFHRGLVAIAAGLTRGRHAN